jgi:hypothetical protein
MIVTLATYENVSLHAPGKIMVWVQVEVKNVLGHVLHGPGPLYLTGVELAEMYNAMDNTGRRKFLEIFATLLQDWERLHQLEMFDEEKTPPQNQARGQMGSQASHDPPRMFLRGGKRNSYRR